MRCSLPDREFQPQREGCGGDKGEPQLHADGECRMSVCQHDERETEKRSCGGGEKRRTLRRTIRSPFFLLLSFHFPRFFTRDRAPDMATYPFFFSSPSIVQYDDIAAFYDVEW